MDFYYKWFRQSAWGVAIANVIVFSLAIIIFFAALGMNPGSVPAHQFFKVFYGHILPGAFFIVMFFMMLVLQRIKYIFITFILYVLLAQGDVIALKMFSSLAGEHGVLYFLSLSSGIINVLITVSLLGLISFGLRGLKNIQSSCGYTRRIIFYLACVVSLMTKSIPYETMGWGGVYGTLGVLTFGFMLGDLLSGIKSKKAA